MAREDAKSWLMPSLLGSSVLQKRITVYHYTIFDVCTTAFRVHCTVLNEALADKSRYRTDKI